MEDGAGKKRGFADSLRRLLDQRGADRSEGESQSAVLSCHGKRHVVGLANLSSSGAMIRFRGKLLQGDIVVLQLLDHGAVTGQVRWIRDGQVGISFDPPLDPDEDESRRAQ